MTERSIYFREPSADAMVRGVLDGSKTQHRQPVNPQPKPYSGGVHPKNTRRHPAPYIDAHCNGPKAEANPRGMSVDWHWWTEDDRLGPFVGKCPFGVPGDRLRARECWQLKNWSDGECAKAGCPDAAKHPNETMYGFPTRAIYRASYNAAIGSPGPWRPSIHMPRWASRITLEVKRVWVERLQDISEADACAEGVIKHAYSWPEGTAPDNARDCGGPYRNGLRNVWDSIYAAKGFGWVNNPWVWGCEFERMKR